MTTLWEIVKDNPDKEWYYIWLSENPNITWEIVKNNLDIKWDYESLSGNPNITWEIVKNNPDKKWNYGYLSQNPNITWEIVRDNPDKLWDWNGISSNSKVFKLPEQNLHTHIKEYISCNRIKRAWHHCNNDPSYLVCRRRLLREYENLI